MNPVMSILKQALPVAASLYAARFITGKYMASVPGISSLPAKAQQPAIAALLAVAGHFATQKVKPLKKHRTGIMTGLAINLIDKIFAAVAPSVATQVGVGDYVAIGQYMTVDGAPPIDDNITLADYVSVDGYEEALGMEQDLGMIEQDLGMEMDLGDFANRNLGGVSRSAMQAPIGHKSFLAPVPARSFTAPVPDFSDSFDKPSKLHTGIFSGGF